MSTFGEIEKISEQFKGWWYCRFRVRKNFTSGRGIQKNDKIALIFMIKGSQATTPIKSQLFPNLLDQNAERT
jgi:hypothetical protein